MSFASKLSIVIEEIDESCFWLEFIVDERLLKEKQVMPLLNEGKELRAIFMASRKTVKNRASEFMTGTKSRKIINYQSSIIN
jgi:four helix bundle protein